MSPICRPVLFGSRAAALGGFLAPWRNGHVGDTDIMCDAAFLQHLIAHNGSRFIETTPGRGIVPCASAGHLNVDTTAALDGRLAMANALGGEIRAFDWAATPVMIGSREVVWATRAHTAGFNPRQHAKAVRDALWYDSLALDLNDTALRLADLCRRDGLAVAAYWLDRNLQENEHGKADG